jgi:hypothetical protein
MPGAKFNEVLVGRVADALQAVVVRQARERIKRHEFPAGQIEAAFNIAKSEADRSASILLFALAEDLMLGCFKEHMNPNVHGGWEAVTGSNGVLATASDRISLLELLYWIRPGTGADLRLMKSIRNRFAHHASVHSFGDKTISGWISSMSHHERPALREIEYYSDRKPSVRSVFLMRSAGALFHLASDIAIGPVARQEKLDPGELLSGDFSEQPENIQDATRAQARLMLSVALEEADVSATNNPTSSVSEAR